MKRLSFITACLVAVALTATAQPVPLYGEVYMENSGKLMQKIWSSAKGNFRSEMTNDDGSSMTVIFRQDSAKFYALDASTKTYMIIPGQNMTNSILGAKVEDGRNTTRKFIGREEVEGKMCDHYEITITTTLTNGRQETGIIHEWIYQPVNSWIKRKEGAFDEAQVMRNIVTGSQPDHLFEIPRDYKAMGLPAGGLMQMLQQSSGKSQAEIKQSSDDTNKKLDQINEIDNDPNKTQEQKTQDLLKMLEGLKK